MGIKVVWSEAVVFAVFAFLGLIIGQWLVEVIGIGANSPLEQLLAFFIPIFIIYVLWKNWGQKAARAAEGK